MTAFDLSVLIFFASVFYKCIRDTFDFWNDLDEENAHGRVRRATVPPRHLPAPSRRSPSGIPVKVSAASSIRAEARIHKNIQNIPLKKVA